MPAFEYSYEHKAFVKKCISCQKTFIGANEQAQAEVVLYRHFPPNNKASDGFLPYCRKCQHNQIRRSRGMVGEIDPEGALLKQGGKCAICTDPILLYQGRGLGAQLDHNHTTGQIRGLLCVNCNSALGKFKDSTEVLQKAIDYLNEWNKICS